MKRYDMMIKIRNYYYSIDMDLCKRFEILNKLWYYKKDKLTDMMINLKIISFDNINNL